MRLAQPDRRSCGAAVLVMARRGLDPDYAARVGDQGSFAAEVLELHRRITSVVDTAGRLQVPWLRAVGTPPWATARELRLLTGVPYAVRAARRGDEAWAHLRHATQERPVAVYVGDRWVPRHVVLVLGRSEDAVWTYEPNAGHVALVSRARWVRGPLRLAGWHRPWLVVSPVPDRAEPAADPVRVRTPRGRRTPA
jgi:hypothetical protein